MYATDDTIIFTVNRSEHPPNSSWDPNLKIIWTVYEQQNWFHFKFGQLRYEELFWWVFRFTPMYGTFCLTLRWDMMSHPVDCVFQASCHHYKCMCSVWNRGKTHTLYGYSSEICNLPRVKSCLISKLDRSTVCHIMSNLEVGQRWLAQLGDDCPGNNTPRRPVYYTNLSFGIRGCLLEKDSSAL